MTMRISFGIVLCSLLAVSSASAVTRNWDGDTSAIWGTAGNWDTAPANSLTTDIANFDLGTYDGVTVFAPAVGTATSINGLTIGASNGSMTLTHTAALSIGNSGISIANGAGAFTISGSTTLGASQGWTNNSANLFTFGAVANGANLLTIGGSGNTTASGVIGNGAGGLTKDGTGLLTLNAANTYTGTTTVNGGELRWGIDNAIAGGAVNINDGGTVNIQTFSDTVGAITINKGGTLTGGTGLYTHAGTFTLADGGTVNGFNGTTSGFINLGNNLSYTSSGASSVMATINRLGAGGATRTLTIARGSDATGVDLDITEVLMGNGAFNLVKAGAGVLRLSGSTASSGRGTGSTVINDGTVILNKSASVEAIGGSGTITIGDNSGSAGTAVLRHATGSANDQILNNAVTINGDGLWDINGHTETTSGALTINRAGHVDLNGGILSVGAAAIVSTSATGSTTPIKNTAGGGGLTLTSTLGITPLTGFTTSLNSGTGTITLGGTVTFTAGGSGIAQITGTELALGAATRTFTIAPVGSGTPVYELEIASPITGGASVGVTKGSTGTLGFSGSSSNTYGGLTTLSANGGTLKLAKTGSAQAIANGGVTIGGADNSIALLQYTGGSSDMMGTGTVTINGRSRLDFNGHTDTIGNVSIVNTGTTTAPNTIINTAGGGNLTIGTLGITPAAAYLTTINSGTGTITLGGNVTFTTATTGKAQITGTELALGGATRTFTVGLGTAASEDLLISAGISGSGVGLTKAGGGRLSLSGTNSYTGATAVNAGTLLVNGSLASGSAVNVANGATLGGNGTIGDTVNVAAGGYLSPGASAGATGTLTLTNNANALTLNGSALYCDVLSNDGSSRDQMAITGNLVLNGTTTLFINAPAGIAAGNYTLMTFAAKIGSGPIVFPNGSTTMGNLTVTVNATDVTLSAGVGGETCDVWSGAASYVWDGGAQNWTKNGTPSQPFATGDAVTFDDTGLAASTITSVGTVSPGSVLFNNSSKNYTVSATIGGTGTPVVKNGSGTVTLSSPTDANTYTGGTTVNAGTLQGTTTSTSLTPPNPLSTGAISLNGSGTILQLRASGTLNTTAETIQFNNNVTVGGDATINIDRPGATSTTKTIQLGTLSIGANTLGVTGGSTYDLRINGATTLTGNATFNNTQNLTLAAAVGDGSADYSLTKTGAGTLILSGANTFSGGVFINAGVLQINSADNLGNSGNLVTFTGDSTINFKSNTTLSQGFAINPGVTGTLWCYKLTTTMTNQLAGSGTLNIQTQGDGYGGLFEFTNTNNTFSGNISIYNWSGGAYAAELRMNSLDDTPGRRIKLGNTAAFTYGTGAVVPLVLSNRQIEHNASSAILNNNATNVNCTVTVNTALIVTSGSRPFTLGGSNIGNNTFAGAITNLTSLTKANAGKWILTGPNTYTGTTTVSAGTLQIAKINSLYSGTAASWITNNLSVASGGVLALNVGGIGEFGTSELATFLDGSHMGASTTAAGFKTGAYLGLDTSNAGGSFTPSAAIPLFGTGNKVGLDKLGTGMLILNVAQSYTGNTRITAGCLQATSLSNLGSSYIQLNGGVLESSGSFTRANSTTAGAANFNWAGSDGGGLSANGGKLTVTVGNSAATEQVWGTTAANNGIWGALKFGSATANSEVEFQNNINLFGVTRTVDVAAGAGGDFATLSGTIRTSSGTAGLTKTGAGTLILSGANTYNGETTISAGTLALGTNNALPSASAIVMGAGTLDVSTYTNSVNTLDVTGVATINLGSGGKLFFADSSSVNSGTWAGTLTITGAFVSRSSIKFGTSAGGLSPAQLSRISIPGGRVGIDANGYLELIRPTLISFF